MNFNTGTSSSTSPAAPPRFSWELLVISLLAVGMQARDARIRYFEAEDRRKALEIDRLQRAAGGARLAA